jgi:hypothetical protein
MVKDFPFASVTSEELGQARQLVNAEGLTGRLDAFEVVSLRRAALALQAEDAIVAQSS